MNRGFLRVFGAGTSEEGVIGSLLLVVLLASVVLEFGHIRGRLLENASGLVLCIIA